MMILMMNDQSDDHLSVDHQSDHKEDVHHGKSDQSVVERRLHLRPKKRNKLISSIIFQTNKRQNNFREGAKHCLKSNYKTIRLRKSFFA